MLAISMVPKIIVEVSITSKVALTSTVNTKEVSLYRIHRFSTIPTVSLHSQQPSFGGPTVLVFRVWETYRSVHRTTGTLVIYSDLKIVTTVNFLFAANWQATSVAVALPASWANGASVLSVELFNGADIGVHWPLQMLPSGDVVLVYTPWSEFLAPRCSVRTKGQLEQQGAPRNATEQPKTNTNNVHTKGQPEQHGPASSTTQQPNKTAAKIKRQKRIERRRTGTKP